jgi:peroxiredoxin
MNLKKGDKLPDAKVFIFDENPKEISIKQIVADDRVIIFGLPGAFTPTCSAKHLPGFIFATNQLNEKNIKKVICISVNDPFVMDAWGKIQNANEKVLMLADGNGEFTAALGLQLDASGFGMGSRSQRFSLVINDGQVEILNVEDGGEFRVSSCEFMLDQLLTLNSPPSSTFKISTCPSLMTKEKR